MTSIPSWGFQNSQQMHGENLSPNQVNERLIGRGLPMNWPLQRRYAPFHSGVEASATVLNSFEYTSLPKISLAFVCAAIVVKIRDTFRKRLFQRASLSDSVYFDTAAGLVDVSEVSCWPLELERLVLSIRRHALLNISPFCWLNRPPYVLGAVTTARAPFSCCTLRILYA